MKALALGIFLVLACGPGRMVSQAVAKPEQTIAQVVPATRPKI